MIRKKKYLTRIECDEIMRLLHTLDDNRDSVIAEKLKLSEHTVAQVIIKENKYKYKYWPTRRKFNRNYSNHEKN